MKSWIEESFLEIVHLLKFFTYIQSCLGFSDTQRSRREFVVTYNTCIRWRNASSDFGKTAKSWAEPGVGGVLAVQTPAVIMRECKQREKRRKGGARSMQYRGNKKRSICSILFCCSLHPAAYISHSPVKVKHHQLLGGYLLASQCHIKTVTFLIQRECNNE